jgi:hypothetical protein
LGRQIVGTSRFSTSSGLGQPAGEFSQSSWLAGASPSRVCAFSMIRSASIRLARPRGRRPRAWPRQQRPSPALPCSLVACVPRRPTQRTAAVQRGRGCSPAQGVRRVAPLMSARTSGSATSGRWLRPRLARFGDSGCPMARRASVRSHETAEPVGQSSSLKKGVVDKLMSGNAESVNASPMASVLTLR